MTRHVAVLLGGWSAEREVSLVSGAAVSNALSEAGYRVTSIDVQRDVGALLTRLFPKPDVVFNALHGRYGEDGCIQGLLNILDIPYTHSGVLASALAMDKPVAKSVMAAAGIKVAEHKIVSQEELIAGSVMEPPFVVKPFNEGSSVGVHIVMEGDNYQPGEEEWNFGRTVMIEKFIPGRELTVTVIGDRALAVTEITTGQDFYDYDAKYAEGGSTHVVPAEIPKDVYDEALRISLLAHQSLGCRGVSRADIRYDGTELYMLEVNTQPGMTPTSLVPEQAAHLNISFNELVSWLVENAANDDQ
ncbi:MAG: D-alanine--D-alanine ligase [Rhodospirillaceae bacterium]|jgi:D-alanine-D-alanine ligase|nr:D-alanine--D-alanine ligase [Rhodospirillaceae bacterium]MBT4589490.1 D-alanine--D-alanine ligase [Rhodospirillaceae bacterium]MBT4937633.1 D-alanine--D-alanine ligase [Rhodospirillaceae bacterium]MBT7268240.1 D-alanine--D-alanine ligase [Rhodospirillaceae bacterium]